jgi:hypothetical protein
MAIMLMMKVSHFEPVTARKINKTVHQCLVIQKWECSMARSCHYSKLKTPFGGNYGVKQIPTDCTGVSGGLPGDMHKNMLKKITGGDKGKRKFPARICRARKKRGETH